MNIQTHLKTHGHRYTHERNDFQTHTKTNGHIHTPEDIWTHLKTCAYIHTYANMCIHVYAYPKIHGNMHKYSETYEHVHTQFKHVSICIHTPKYTIAHTRIQNIWICLCIFESMHTPKHAGSCPYSWKYTDICSHMSEKTCFLSAQKMVFNQSPAHNKIIHGQCPWLHVRHALGHPQITLTVCSPWLSELWCCGHLSCPPIALLTQGEAHSTADVVISKMPEVHRVMGQEPWRPTLCRWGAGAGIKV